MPNSRCFLIGHRDTSSDILPSLTTEIEHHIREQGITEFVVGQYGGFDRLAAHALYRCKTEYPGLTLTLLCAYHPVERAVILPRGFDGFWYPAGLEQVPRRFAIQRANRLAVEQSEYLIAGLRHPGSCTASLVRYALGRQRQGKLTVTLLPLPDGSPCPLPR